MKNIQEKGSAHVYLEAAIIPMVTPPPKAKAGWLRKERKDLEARFGLDNGTCLSVLVLAAVFAASLACLRRSALLGSLLEYGIYA